jgi:hypothetical protein
MWLILGKKTPAANDAEMPIAIVVKTNDHRDPRELG